MNFASDNIHGVDEAILAAIGEANQQLAAPSYAADAWTERACDKLNEVFERKVDAFLVPSGTAGNTSATVLRWLLTRAMFRHALAASEA